MIIIDLIEEKKEEEKKNTDISIPFIKELDIELEIKKENKFNVPIGIDFEKSKYPIGYIIFDYIFSLIKKENLKRNESFILYNQIEEAVKKNKLKSYFYEFKGINTNTNTNDNTFIHEIKQLIYFIISTQFPNKKLLFNLQDFLNNNDTVKKRNEEMLVSVKNYNEMQITLEKLLSFIPLSNAEYTIIKKELISLNKEKCLQFFSIENQSEILDDDLLFLVLKLMYKILCYQN